MSFFFGSSNKDKDKEKEKSARQAQANSPQGQPGNRQVPPSPSSQSQQSPQTRSPASGNGNAEHRRSVSYQQVAAGQKQAIDSANESVAALMSMGFTRERSVAALKYCSFHLEAAIDYCLNTDDPANNPAVQQAPQTMVRQRANSRHSHNVASTNSGAVAPNSLVDPNAANKPTRQASGRIQRGFGSAKQQQQQQQGVQTNAPPASSPSQPKSQPQQQAQQFNPPPAVASSPSQRRESSNSVDANSLAKDFARQSALEVQKRMSNRQEETNERVASFRNNNNTPSFSSSPPQQQQMQAPTPQRAPQIQDGTVVIDHGSYVMRCGLTDIDRPRCVFPTTVASKQAEDGHNKYYVGETAKPQNNCRVPYNNGVIDSWEDMEAVWEHCFSASLNVDTTTTRVLLTEPHGVARDTREKTMESMFELFDVEASYLHVQPVLALFAAGLTTGCVVDSGELTTTVYPIADGFHFANAVTKLQYGGAQITEILTRLLLEKGCGGRFGEIASLNQLITPKKLNTVRLIKEQYALVRADLTAVPKSVSVTLPDGKPVTLDEELCRCTEKFFQPQLFNQMLNVDDAPLPQTIFKSISNCSLDVRKTLFSNIVLAGGNTMFSGFERRLTSEVKKLVPGAMASSVNVGELENRNIACWVGGSILATMSTFEERWITSEEYDEVGVNIVHEKCPQHL